MFQGREVISEFLRKKQELHEEGGQGFQSELQMQRHTAFAPGELHTVQYNWSLINMSWGIGSGEGQRGKMGLECYVGNYLDAVIAFQYITRQVIQQSQNRETHRKS